MRVLLTGATGFVGSHVARLMVRDGADVFALVREGSDTWRIDDIAPMLRLVRGDLLDAEAVKRHVDEVRPELCIHLGWYAEPGKYLESMLNLDMLAASLSLVSELAEVGCRRFVGAGTCFEYDTAIGYLSESSPQRPLTLYASCKASLGHVLEHVLNVTGMETAWLRLFYLYGPFEDRRRLVPSIANALLAGDEARATEGWQTRDYLHVEDVASALWAVAQSSLSGAANVGSGVPVAVRDVVTGIGDIVGRPELVRLGALPHREGDPESVYADNRRLVEGTGWSPAFGLEDGLRHTVEWWRARTAAYSGVGSSPAVPDSSRRFGMT